MNSLSTTMKAFPNNGKYFDYKNYLEQTFYPQLKTRCHNDFHSCFSSTCTMAVLLQKFLLYPMC